VEFIKKGDIVSVPLMFVAAKQNFDRYLFKCKWRSPEELTDMWDGMGVNGGQEYVMVPCADFNLLKFLTKIKPKILDLTMLTDIPNRFHGAVMAGVKAGRIYRVQGQLSSVCLKLPIIRCSYVIVGDLNEERLAHARSFGCETINLTNGIPVQEQIAMIVGA
jgi:glutathione-independent formaldehyde dehydrogenase